MHHMTVDDHHADNEESYYGKVQSLFFRPIVSEIADTAHAERYLDLISGSNVDKTIFEAVSTVCFVLGRSR